MFIYAVFIFLLYFSVVFILLNLYIVLHYLCEYEPIIDFKFMFAYCRNWKFCGSKYLRESFACPTLSF